MRSLLIDVKMASIYSAIKSFPEVKKALLKVPFPAAFVTKCLYSIDTLLWNK